MVVLGKQNYVSQVEPSQNDELSESNPKPEPVLGQLSLRPTPTENGLIKEETGRGLWAARQRSLSQGKC